jgi:aspartokinase/homoserine dehydrogenase 1
MRSSILVHKFGGTSVAGADRYRNVARIVTSTPHAEHAGARRTQGVVVSAMSKVTDGLLDLVSRARQRDDTYAPALEALLTRHRDTAAELLPRAEAERLAEVFARDGRDLADVLRAVWLGRGASELTEELVSGYGELWSAQLLSAHLAAEGHDAAWLDAREVLVVSTSAHSTTSESGPRIDWALSEKRLGDWRAAHPAALVVITGFIAATREGVPTTLKRNGSDFSGSIFGALFGAEEIVIWTDVDGVLSADPRRVPEAVVLDAMSYDEACELAYFGAKVLHPRTMEPAIARDIPIRIKNTFAPERPGSLIASPRRLEGLTRRAVAGFSTFDGIALVNLEGSGMIGVPGVAERLFGALRGAGVSVVLISQGSSEHSICVAVPESHGGVAREVITRAFAPEIGEGLVQRVELVPGQTILAAVGDQMAHTPGVAATFFSSLAKAGVSVRAIAQGSSERNISAVVDRADSTRALRAVHAGFVLSDRVLSVGLVGPGLVGKALLSQLAEQAPVLRETLHIDLRLRAVADSKRMALSETGLSPERALIALEASATPLDLDALAAHVRAPHLPHAVMIDATASEEIAARYEGWLAAGLHVVTPNKRAGAGSLARYRALRAHEARGRSWLYEATVGAGLPVIATLRDLVRTGDRVTKVEGVLSGTLSYVFNVWDGTRPFSEVVRDAKTRGYTEPDPRDDLSGTDVARKLVILAREMGVRIELSDVEIESLVPEALRRDASEGGVSASEFLEALAQHDDAMKARLDRARAEGAVLRYVGVVTAEGRAKVALLPYAQSHAFAGLAATDNVIAFSSARYASQPLVVRGPGAGPEVTAGGVFADLLRLATSLA